MNNNKTDITILLDRTGSMKSVQKSTIDAFNEFITKQKAVPVEATLTLVQFDDVDPKEIVFSGPLNNTPELTEATYIPRGMTPLHDAMGMLITKTGERLAAIPESERPEKVLFAIITDGQENASTEYKQEQVAGMVTHQRETYKWDFVFIGANQDAVLTAKHYNIPAAMAASYVHTNTGMAATMTHLASNVVSYRGMGATGQSLNFTEDQRTDMMGKQKKGKKKEANKP